MLDYKYKKLAEEYLKGGPYTVETLGEFIQRVVNSDIRRQVAFKGAIEMLSKSPDEWNSQAIVNEVRFLTDEFEKILHEADRNTLG